jgi:hypothetical protein
MQAYNIFSKIMLTEEQKSCRCTTDMKLLEGNDYNFNSLNISISHIFLNKACEDINSLKVERHVKQKSKYILYILFIPNIWPLNFCVGYSFCIFCCKYMYTGQVVCQLLKFICKWCSILARAHLWRLSGWSDTWKFLKLQEVLGRTNRLLSFDITWTT